MNHVPTRHIVATLLYVHMQAESKHTVFKILIDIVCMAEWVPPRAALFSLSLGKGVVLGGIELFALPLSCSLLNFT